MDILTQSSHLQLLAQNQPGCGIRYEFKRLLIYSQTEIDHRPFFIAEIEGIGLALFIDNQIQVCELDQHLFHEFLIQPAMLTHPQPKNVLILGGGDGGAAFQVLKHPQVEKVMIVDYSQAIVDACKQFLPHVHHNSFADKRVEIVIQPATHFLKSCKEHFDVVIVDLTDGYFDTEIASMAALSLADLKHVINPGGVVAFHTGLGSPKVRRQIAQFVQKISVPFPHYQCGSALIPSFFEEWMFVIAASDPIPPLSPQEIENRLQQRGISNLHEYDGESHQKLFALRKGIRQVVKR